MQRAIAAVQNSRVGNGGAAHRVQGASRFVEHGHHAAFHLRTFLEVGGYDERISHNEDAELDCRLLRSGYRIYLDSARTIDYFPRAGLRALARQYFNFGWGRANTLLRHRTLPRARQIAPVVILALNCLGIGLALLNSWFLALPIAYLASLVIWSALSAVSHRDMCRLMCWAAAATMHHAWALGHLSRLGQALTHWDAPFRFGRPA
jgi:succinoglycan biosynthesis protein ExoA